MHVRELLYESLALLGRRALDPDRAAAAGRLLGAAMWQALPSRRRLAAQTIAERLGLPGDEAEALARASFVHTARSFLEIFCLDRVDARFMSERLTIRDPEIFRSWRESERPGVVATAHLGAWELMGGIAGRLIQDRPKMVVVRRPKDLALHRTMLRLRSRADLEIVEHRNAAFKVLKGLRRGGMAAFLVDHNASREEAVFLPFLGRTAAVNAGPALLAVRAKALVWPAFLLREEGRPARYILRMEPPLDTAALDGERQERIAAAAGFYTRAVERAVRACPAQWFWMHKRWKTRPSEEGAEGAPAGEQPSGSLR